jgi:Peptidase family M28
MSRRLLALTLIAFACTTAIGATEPNAATRRWWSHIQALASDSMQGRDTGSPEHRKAQEYVVGVLERNGVKPAGEQGFYQTVPLHSYRLRASGSTAAIERAERTEALHWLRDITVSPAMGLPAAIKGRMVFAGSDNAAGLEVANAVVVRLNPTRLVPGPPVQRPPAGAAAVVGIDSAVGPEPSRWPAQNALTMTLAETPIAAAQGLPSFRFNPASADKLLAGSGHSYKELVDLSTAGKPVPSFVLPGTLSLTMAFDSANLTSDNAIGVLPGSDPTLASQHVVLTAHIDGYGLGEPWGEDRIYNGAFDDAAYVATLLDFAERLHENHTTLRRSLLFAIVTGEEKGLLGSRYYTTHLTVPRDRLVADINLDQLRPLFPLHTLTMHAVDESTLGDTARQVAGPMGITIQADPEPLRNLVRRSDNYPFMQIGVPATGFVFGYKPGTSDEVAYRRWYRDRYHTPLDDLSQPWVPDAAAKFNDFFARLVTAVANADEAPAWKPGSQFAPKD